MSSEQERDAARKAADAFDIAIAAEFGVSIETARLIAAAELKRFVLRAQANYIKLLDAHHPHVEGSSP